MKSIAVPSYDHVSAANQAIFDNLKKDLGWLFNRGAKK